MDTAEDDDTYEGDDDEDPRGNASEMFNALARFLAPWLRRHRRLVVLLAMGVLLEMAYNTTFPLAMRSLIDDALLGGDRQVLVMVLGLLVTGGVVSCAVNIGRDYVDARLGAYVLADVRQQMFEHLQTLSLRYFQRSQSADILQRFSSDVGVIENAVTTIVSCGVIPLAEVVTSTALLFILDWRLALVATLVFPFGLLAPRVFASRALGASHERRAAEAGMLHVVQENIAAQPVVKAFGLEKVVRLWFRLPGLRLRHEMQQMNFYSAMVERSADIVIMILHVLVVGIGAVMVFSDALTVGSLVTFESVFLNLSYSIGYVTQFVPTLVQSAGGVRRVAELLDERPDFTEAPDAIVLPNSKRVVEFRGVTFAYSDGAPVLDALDLRIEPGSYVVIHGASGSGKSTLLALLLRFFDPVAGEIRFGGHDIRRVTHLSLRSRMSIVFQETVLFDMTLRENIRLGRPRATDAEVEKAAKAAGIHDFITSLPDGYDSIVGERGNKLSGGQRQRIAIARAMVREPAILLLDEATSALDHESEDAVNETVARLAGQCTIIAVTHRPERIRGADRHFELAGGVLRECSSEYPQWTPE